MSEKNLRMTTFLKKNNFKHSIFLMGLILFVLMGFFGLVQKVNAVEGRDDIPDVNAPQGDCTYSLGSGNSTVTKITSETYCKVTLHGTWVVRKVDTSALEDTLNQGCQAGWWGQNWSFKGCFLWLFYNTLFLIPSGMLYVSALFFNALISIVIQSKWYDREFITNAWVVVRDLSNMFFILILLYIAVKVILDIGGHEAKKMIASVIMMAVLINFSLFFTRIIIDSSNILALIFYNKLDVSYKKPNGELGTRPNTPSTSDKEKDLSGAMYKNFNATKLLTKEFLDTLRKQQVPTENASGGKVTVVEDSTPLPFGLTMLMLLVAGTIMAYAAAVFFLSGLYFLGRLIDLWVLMIFAPFAFMSFSVPLLSHTEGIGWDSWFKKLLATSFMAPIFMFILYLIFLLLDTNIFSDLTTTDNPGAMATILGVVLPALIILGLLSKAKDFAKKGGGQFGEMMAKGGSVLAGLAIGGGIGLAAKGLQATVGAAGMGIMENKKWADMATSEKFGSRLIGKGMRKFGGFAESSTFDARKGIAGTALKMASSATGLNLGHGSNFVSTEEGGYKADLKRRHDAREKIAEGLRHTAAHHATEELEKAEEEKRKLALENKKALEEADKAIKSQEGKVANAKHSFESSKGTEDEEHMRLEYQEEVEKLKRLNTEKSKIKNGMERREDGSYTTDNGKISASAVKAANESAEQATERLVKAEKAAAEASDRSTKAQEKNDQAIRDASQAEKELASAIAQQKLMPSDESLKVTVRTMEGRLATAQKTVQETSDSVGKALAAVQTTKARVERATMKNNAAQKAVADINEEAKNGTGNSQNDYEDNIIPEAKRHVEEVEEKITQKYAKRIPEGFSFHSAQELRRSAYKIRMRAKSDSHGEKKSSGHNLGEAVLAEFVAGALSGGDHGGGDDKHDATDHAPAVAAGGAHHQKR